MIMKLKAWQLFTLLLLPIIIEGFLPFNEMQSLHYVLKTLFVILYLYWLYTFGTSLYAKLENSSGLSIQKFKFNFWYVVFYIGLISIIVTYNLQDKITLPWLIVPFHLLAMFSMFYILYFNAKALVSLEIERKATFNDYIGTFFLIWFFPIGIWGVQPRARRVLK